MQFLWKEVNQHCIDIDGRELFSTIAERRLSEDPNQIQRPSIMELHCVYEDSRSALRIDKYCPRQNMFTAVKEFDLGRTLSTMVYRNGKLIIIGGSANGNSCLNTVNIKGQFLQL